MLEVGDNGRKLDIEPFVENIRIQIRPFAFIFAPIGKFGSKNVFKPRFDFGPYFVGGLTRTDEIRIGISLNIFKRQTVKMIAGQGLQPVPKRIERNEQEDAAVDFVHDIFLDFR